MENTEVDKVLEIFKNGYNRQVILYGPPGTSKTYSAKLIADEFLGKDDESKERLKVVQFHPSYNYEDFVRGIEVEVKGGNPNYKTVNKIFGEIAEKAKAEKDEAKNYVLIIDEINRAPLASVLGELIYGLEYRNESISTPYTVGNTNSITIPDNLYIIGTMNTADRSIGSIDYAVRRRFAFIPLLSDREKVEQSWEDSNLKEKVLALFDKVQELFEEKNLADSSIHAEDIKIGHTYFLYDEEKCTDEKEARAYMKYRLEYQIIPIIEEYIKDGLLKDIINIKELQEGCLDILNAEESN